MIRTGMDVYAADGRLGQLHAVVLDRETRQVTDLIVTSGFLRREGYIIPLHAVAEVADDQIRINMSCSEARRRPVFREQVIETPAPGWDYAVSQARREAYHWAMRYGAVPTAQVPLFVRQRVCDGIDADKVVVCPHTPVYGVQGLIGHVESLAVDERSGRVHELVVRKRWLPSRTVLPGDALRQVSETGVFVRSQPPARARAAA